MSTTVGNVKVFGTVEMMDGKLFRVRFDSPFTTYPHSGRSSVTFGQNSIMRWKVEARGNGTVITGMMHIGGRLEYVRHNGSPTQIDAYARRNGCYPVHSHPDDAFSRSNLKPSVDLTEPPGRFDSFISGFLDFFRRFM